MAFRYENKFNASAETARNSASSEQEYYIFCPLSDAVSTINARDWLYSQISDVDNWNNPIESINVSESTGSITERIFEAVVRYSSVVSNAEDFNISFTNSGGTIHTDVSFTTRRYPPTLVDRGYAIGFNSDGGLDGVDIMSQEIRFTVEKKVLFSSIPLSAIGLIGNLKATVNNIAFNGYAPYEVIFSDFKCNTVSGDYIDPDTGVVSREKYWNFTMEFQRSPNLENVTLAGIQDVTKYGWEYLEYEKELSEDSDTKALLPTIVGVRVHQVYLPSSYVQTLISYGLLPTT